MEASVVERRRDVRIPHEVQVTLGSGNDFYTGFTLDISAGGVFVATPAPPPVGTQVSFELTFGPLSKVPVTGEVRWVKTAHPAGVGVQFCELHPKLRDYINRFLAEKGESLFWDADE